VSEGINGPDPHTIDEDGVGRVTGIHWPARLVPPVRVRYVTLGSRPKRETLTRWTTPFIVNVGAMGGGYCTR